ncbi:MAG: hypothetical protein AAFX39_00850 [Pseudomonadota bacterium]
MWQFTRMAALGVTLSLGLAACDELGGGDDTEIEDLEDGEDDNGDTSRVMPDSGQMETAVAPHVPTVADDVMSQPVRTERVTVPPPPVQVAALREPETVLEGVWAHDEGLCRAYSFTIQPERVTSQAALDCAITGQIDEGTAFSGIVEMALTCEGANGPREEMWMVTRHGSERVIVTRDGAEPFGLVRCT